jgi:hypothetical protein
MDRLKTMKETLISCIEGQMTHLDSVDTKELGEVIDMVKDLEEAIYYGTITEAMKGEDKHSKHFVEYIYPYKDDYNIYPYEHDRDVDRSKGRMYYGGRGSGSSTTEGGPGTVQYYGGYDYPVNWPVEMKDAREGKSGKMRKMYMESKEMHHDKSKLMKDLEMYMQELSSDITEMISDATPEERQYLSSKISALATKITPAK